MSPAASYLLVLLSCLYRAQSVLTNTASTGTTPAGITIQCGKPFAGLATAGSQVRLSLGMPYFGDVDVYLYGAEPFQLTAARALNVVSKAVLSSTQQIYMNRGYLGLSKLNKGKVNIELDGIGTGPFWILCDCKEVTTTLPPTPPPTPLPATALTLGTVACGTGIIGDYGKTPQMTGTISLETTMTVSGSMALYVNGLVASKLKAFIKPPPASAAVPARGSTIGAAPGATSTGHHPYHLPIAQTDRQGVQFLHIPNLARGTTVIFHIDLQGSGEYFCITNCRTPAPTMAPTRSPTLAPTTRMPTAELTPP